MFLGPVVERELRRALRANKGTKSRFRVALYGVMISALFLWISFVGGSAGSGGQLHHLLFFAGLYLAIAPPIRISAGLFSEERRNQTLELLFLTGMNSGELFIEKLLGGMLVASADLLALAPAMAMPFLTGGISLDLYLATLACLPALFVFVVAVGVFSSVMFKDDGLAIIFMVALAGCICLAAPIPYCLGGALSGAAPFSARWLCLSPAYAPYLVVNNFGSAGPREYWVAALAILAWSGLCLGTACYLLNRNWRSEVRGAARSKWQGSFQTWVHGGQSWRVSLRRRLLPANPYHWLTEQDRRPVLTGYGSIGLICVLWLIGWRTWPQAWPSTANFFVTAMVLIAMVNWLKLFTAARRIATDRRDGILELLLTTSLSPQEIVEGEVAALSAAFRPLQFVAFALCVLMMAGGFAARPWWNTRAAIEYIAVWCVLCAWSLKDSTVSVLRVMWAALNTGRPAYSVFRWAGRRWIWIWALYMLRDLFTSGFGGPTPGFPTGSIVEFAMVCTIGIPMGVFYYLWLAAQPDIERDLRRRLTMEMRLIAIEPLPDPHDPAFKKWDGVRRLQYRSNAHQALYGWPGFVDPPDVDPVRDWASRGISSDSAITPLDALELFQRLRERGIDYLVVGEQAMNAYLGSRNTRDADVLMSADAITGIAELRIRERTDFFCSGQFRGIRVVIYSTTNPFFEDMRQQCATTITIGGAQIPAATPDALVALNLYATHLVSRQREFYRTERYEVNIIALLARHRCSHETILSLLTPHVPEQYLEEVGDTLESCAKHAARMRKRQRKIATVRDQQIA